MSIMKKQLTKFAMTCHVMSSSPAMKANLYGISMQENISTKQIQKSHNFLKLLCGLITKNGNSYAFFLSKIIDILLNSGSA